MKVHDEKPMKQRDRLRAIFKMNATLPSLDEMSKQTGIPTGSISGEMSILRRKGWIFEHLGHGLGYVVRMPEDMFPQRLDLPPCGPRRSQIDSATEGEILGQTELPLEETTGEIGMVRDKQTGQFRKDKSYDKKARKPYKRKQRRTTANLTLEQRRETQLGVLLNIYDQVKGLRRLHITGLVALGIVTISTLAIAIITIIN